MGGLLLVLQLRLISTLLTLVPRVRSSSNLTRRHHQLMSASVPHYASCQRQVSSSPQVSLHERLFCIVCLFWVVFSLSSFLIRLLFSIFPSRTNVNGSVSIYSFTHPVVTSKDGWIPRRQPHRRSSLANLPFVGAVP